MDDRQNPAAGPRKGPAETDVMQPVSAPLETASEAPAVSPSEAAQTDARCYPVTSQAGITAQEPPTVRDMYRLQTQYQQQYSRQHPQGPYPQARSPMNTAATPAQAPGPRAYSQPVNGYQRPSGYSQNPYPMQGQQPRSAPNTGPATASLVLGIVSLIFAWLSVLAVISIPCAIVGIILGSISRRELPPEYGRGTATAGMVCSIIGLVLAVLIFALSILFLLTAFRFTTRFGPVFGV